MNSQKNIMLDLETLSTRPNAAIIVIAAIQFHDDVQYEEELSEEKLQSLNTFYRRIDLSSLSGDKYHVDEKTVSWWETQEKSIAHEALHQEPRMQIKNALQDFANWVGNDKNTVKIWGNGSSFDVTILGEAFELEHLEVCWKFWNVRDLRTIMDFGKVRMNDLPQFKKHHALWDCYRQIVGFQRCIRNINSQPINKPILSKKRKM
jgi:hypothetical protein